MYSPLFYHLLSVPQDLTPLLIPGQFPSLTVSFIKVNKIITFANNWKYSHSLSVMITYNDNHPPPCEHAAFWTDFSLKIPSLQPKTHP